MFDRDMDQSFLGIFGHLWYKFVAPRIHFAASSIDTIFPYALLNLIELACAGGCKYGRPKGLHLLPCIENRGFCTLPLVLCLRLLGFDSVQPSLFSLLAVFMAYKIVTLIK